MMRVLRAAAVAVAAASAAACSSSAEERAIATMREAVDAARAGDVIRAEDLALRARDERPGFVDPLFLAARLREKDGRWAEARDAYREILATDPTSTAAAVALALTFVAERRPADAEDWLRRALEEDPGAEAAAFNLGSLAAERGDFESAAGWFALSAALDTRDPRAPLQIARARLAQGRRDDAREAVDEAIRRAPDFAPARAFAESLAR